MAIAFGTAAWAVTAEQEAKLLASDGDAFDFLGSSVALDGDTAIIGAPGDDDNGLGTGAAYAFTRTAGVWTQEDKLLVPGPNADPGDTLGNSVALDGDTAVIGAFMDDDNGLDSGSAFVFTRTAGVWTAVAILLADDGEAEDIFGVDLALDGDTLLIGASRDDDLGPDSGSAYVFTRTAGVWTQQAKLTAADGAASTSAFFGGSVALDGDTALISAHGDDETALNSGAAYVFTRTAGIWTQQAKLLADDGGFADGLGLGVSLDGDTAIAGASTADGSVPGTGAAYVFTRTAGVWTQQAKLTAADGALFDDFGMYVSLDGDTVVISANQDDDNGLDAGSAYVFTRAAGVWTEQAELLATDGEAGDVFGRSVAVDGDTLLVGARGDDDNGESAGAAYVFRLEEDGDGDDVPAAGGLGLMLLALALLGSGAFFMRRRTAG